MPFWTPRPQEPPFADPPAQQVFQNIQLLGPFLITFNTPGIEDDRVAFGPVLTNADVVLDIYVPAIVPWDTTTAVLTLGVVYSDESGQDFAGWDVQAGSPYQTDQYTGALFSTDSPAGDVRLAAFVEVTGGPAAAGQAQVYALIASAE